MIWVNWMVQNLNKIKYNRAHDSWGVLWVYFCIYDIYIYISVYYQVYKENKSR